MIPSEVFPEKDVYIESPLPIDVDKAGNVKAVGNREQAIFKFDPEGKPLLTFGGPGQGPGDLQWPYSFDVNGREKTIFVADNIGLSLFSTDGTFIRRFRTFGPVLSVCATSHSVYLLQPGEQGLINEYSYEGRGIGSFGKKYEVNYSLYKNMIRICPQA